jgi:hypothetical protein
VDNHQLIYASRRNTAEKGNRRCQYTLSIKNSFLSSPKMHHSWHQHARLRCIHPLAYNDSPSSSSSNAYRILLMLYDYRSPSRSTNNDMFKKSHVSLLVSFENLFKLYSVEPQSYKTCPLQHRIILALVPVRKLENTVVSTLAEPTLICS